MASPHDDSFEAALSLVDEFAFDEALDGDLPSLYATGPDAPTRTPDALTSDSAGEGIQSKSPTRTSSGGDKSRRRAEYNMKRKVLRKAGVYSDPNRARNARVKEIADLRELVENLQLDLKVLQSHNPQHKPVPRASNSTAVVSTSRIPNKWKEIAGIQRRRRKEAEGHNVRLKLALENQQTTANSLYRLLRKRASQLTNECSSLMDLVCAKNYIVDVLEFGGDIGEFQELLRRLDVAYREVDAVFAANGLADASVLPCDVHVRYGADYKYLELFSYKVLPFHVRTTTEVAWNHFKGVEKHLGNGSIYKKAEKGLDEPYTILADFTKEVYSNNSRADIKVKQIVRRYVEPDRDIVIWVSRAEPAEIKHKMLRGLTYRLRGYAVIQCFPESPPDQELSVFRQCSLISLDHKASTTYSLDDVSELTNFLVANAAQNIRVHRELIENALIQQSRTHTRL